MSTQAKKELIHQKLPETFGDELHTDFISVQYEFTQNEIGWINEMVSRAHHTKGFKKKNTYQLVFIRAVEWALKNAIQDKLQTIYLLSHTTYFYNALEEPHQVSSDPAKLIEQAKQLRVTPPGVNPDPILLSTPGVGLVDVETKETYMHTEVDEKEIQHWIIRSIEKA